MVSAIDRQTEDLPVAGARLGISRNHSYELARKGEFPVRVLKLGRRYVVVKAELDALLSGKVALGQLLSEEGQGE
jgi:predicted DNA-binding transcriptional regulator AlpA